MKMKICRIRNKTVVKYLGVNIDQYLYFNNHITIQLDKARKAFMLLNRLFFSKHLNSRVKVICYLTLVRPILTYGGPIWYNISSSYMEKLRIFERKCLRACLGKYRTAESDYQQYISNQELYDMANIQRIDVHILHLIRDHFANASQSENNLVAGPCFEDPIYLDHTLKTGHIPPEAFLHLDKLGLIQDSNNTPIIYHANRHATEKSITYERNLNTGENLPIWRFNKSISKRDKEDESRKNTGKYWWLEDS